MLWQQIGTPNAFVQSASSAALTPTWAASQPRTAGDLLLMPVTVHNTVALPAAPAGWSVAKQQAASSGCSASLFYKVATGGDANPTIAAIPGGIISAQLVEYSGPLATGSVDQSGGAANATGTLTVTNGGANATGGELEYIVLAAVYSVAGTKTITLTSNQPFGFGPNNNSTSTANHYLTAGVNPSTALGATADSFTATIPTAALTNSAMIAVSFLAAPNGILSSPRQAVQRAATV